MTMEPSSDSVQQSSPPWGANVKLVVGFTLVAIVAAFLIRFQAILPLLLMTVIATYLLHPVISLLQKTTRFSWRWSVNIVFLILITGLVTAFALTGFALVQQLESLIGVIERFINQLPEMVLAWTTTAYKIGPFELDMSQYLSSINIESLTQGIISTVRPMLGQAGNVLTTVATGTVTIVGQGFFILLLAYFILADAGRVSSDLFVIDLPGYDDDIHRMGRELSRIWNAFLRGQVILFTITLIIYSILLLALDVRYVLGLALLAGFARFVPYVGQWVTWIVLFVVIFFQKTNHFSLSSTQYLVLVFIIVIVIDQILDGIIAPKILGESLGVHPAAVLVAAMIALNLLGLLGVVLAAPVLATLTLVGGYVIRKMLDQDVWPVAEEEQPLSSKLPISEWAKTFLNWLRERFRKIKLRKGELEK